MRVDDRRFDLEGQAARAIVRTGRLPEFLAHLYLIHAERLPHRPTPSWCASTGGRRPDRHRPPDHGVDEGRVVVCEEHRGMAISSVMPARGMGWFWPCWPSSPRRNCRPVGWQAERLGEDTVADAARRDRIAAHAFSPSCMARTPSGGSPRLGGAVDHRGRVAGAACRHAAVVDDAARALLIMIGAACFMPASPSAPGSPSPHRSPRPARSRCRRPAPVRRHC